MKNNPIETGVVYLEDLPQKKIFVCLKRDFYEILDSKIRKFGMLKLSIKLGISEGHIRHWLVGNSDIRLDVLNLILDFFSFSNLEENIYYLKGKKGGRIYNLKLPFDFTSSSGVRVIAGILGDGGIPSNRPNPYYTNSNQNLINGFIEDMRCVFGDLEFSSREIINSTSTITTILDFPSLIQKVFLRIGLKSGKKVETNQNIPPFIFNLGEKERFSFITQFFDDEGSVNILAKHITFTSSCLERYGASNLLKDAKKLLLTLNIESSIHFSGKYSSLRGEDRKTCKLQINGQFQLKRLYNNLDLKILEKKEKIKLLLQSVKLRVFRKKEWLSVYLKFIEDIEDSKGYFTSLDLSRKSGMVVGSCRNTLLRLKKQGLTRCIKDYRAGKNSEFARYILI